MVLACRGAVIAVGILLLSALLVLPALSKMGYSIRVDAEGTTWEIKRSTQVKYFSTEGTVTGEGNFSRRSYIKGDMGISTYESSSSPRSGSLSINERMRFWSKEGPVSVTANLWSKNLTDDDNSENITGSALIRIDEAWPAHFTSYKETKYLGPAIRAREIYENNGDVVASHIESKKLARRGIFTTSINRTLINARVTPGSVVEWTNFNKSSYYATDMKTIGSLVGLDISRQDAYDNIVFRAIEEYRGQTDIALQIRMDDAVNLNDNEMPEWLSCLCQPGNASCYLE